MIQADDIGLAGLGDLSALLRLRDYWYGLATGETFNPFLPADEALPQLELLAEMVAARTNEAKDRLCLAATYQVRIESLERAKAAAERFAKDSVTAQSIDDLDYWTRSVVEAEQRLERYRAKIDELIRAALNDSEIEGPALIVAALTLEADRGNEKASAMIQPLIDSMTPERAAAVRAKIQTVEKESAQ